jgi:HlyD family secretion protein
MQLPWIGKKVDRRTPWVIGLAAAGLLTASAGTYVVVNRATPKSDVVAELTVPVEAKNLTVRITASGTVVPIQSVNISPKTAGLLRELRVEQGDKVEAGQIIARMDDSQLQAQLAQARASLAQAQAQLDKLRAGSRKEEIAQARSRLNQAQAQLAEAQAGSRPEEIAQARARLAQAQAQLAEAQAGSRPQEIAQARARLAQAQAQLTAAQASNPQQIAQAKAQVQAAQARVDLARQRQRANQSLAQQGAISQDRLQEVISEYLTATANLEEAKRRLTQVQTGTSPGEIAQRQAAVTEAQQALEQLQKGTRSEVIAQRQAAVAEARQALEQRQNGTRSEEIARRQAAVAEARQALEMLQNGSRPEDIAQAQATVAEARGRLQAVQVQIEDTIIRAPFAGTVTQKYANVGAFVAPTTSSSAVASATSSSIVAIARGVEVLARVPEVDIGQIKLNQPVEIVADAYPDQVFKGRVRLIAPEAVVDQNVTSFQVRAMIDTGQDLLRSGMNIDLTFLGQELSNALVVPTVAIVTEKGQQGVMIPGQKNKPEFRPVTIGPTIGDQTQILQGVNVGDRVFIDMPKDSRPKPAAD